MRQKLLTLGHLGLGWFIAGCVGQRGHEATSVDAASVTPRVFAANIFWPKIEAPPSPLVERAEVEVDASLPQAENSDEDGRNRSDLSPLGARYLWTEERQELEEQYIERLLGAEFQQEIAIELGQQQERFERQLRQLNYRKRGSYEFFLHETSDGKIELHRRMHLRSQQSELVIGPRLKGSPVLQAKWNSLQISDDGRRVALQTASESSGLQSLWFVDLQSKKFNEVAHEISFRGGAWATDNRHYLYGASVQSENRTEIAVFRFDAETNKSDQSLEIPEGCIIDQVARTHSRQYLWAGLQCGASYSIHRWQGSRPWQEPVLVRALTPGQVLAFEHHVESYVALVEGSNGEVHVERRSMRSDQPKWETWFSGEMSRGYERMDAFADYLVFWRRLPWSFELEFVVSRGGGRPTAIEFPERPFELYAIEPQTFDSPDYRFGFRSPNQDLVLYDYQVAHQKLMVPENVRGELPRQHSRAEISRYQLQRQDGSLFTLNVIRRSSNQPSGAGLLILGHDKSVNEFTGYTASREALLERDLAYAYLSAEENTDLNQKFLSKLLLVEDFLQAARFLNEMSIVPIGGIVGIGSHSSACAVATAMSREPQRFAGAWLHQPSTEKVRNNTEDLDCLPPAKLGGDGQHLRPPPILLSESIEDSETSEALEWTAILRNRRDYRSPTMLKLSRAEPREFSLANDLVHTAYAFILRCVGKDEPSESS